jgi:endonuclease/exonuclease/phosphatase family metal-dependent hydrolase
MTRASLDLRIVTYNIHRCRGLDRLTRPDRIAEVLRAIDPDIVALQEVVGPGPRGANQAELLGAMLGMASVMAPTRLYRGHQFGNAVLSRVPIVHHVQHDLTWKTCEPRCCQRVDLQVHSRALHFYNVHLGTAHRERQYQAERLIGFVGDRRVRGPRLVLGDFNEWLRGLATSLLGSVLTSIELPASVRRKRTYPGIFPVLHLDHIYHDGAIEVLSVDLPRTRRTLVASDHLPLVADLRVRI